MATLASRFPFLLGCTIDREPLVEYSDAERRLITEQFNTFTVENSLKGHRVQPGEGKFHFEYPDALLQFADQQAMKMVGHCLIWHQQYPDWFFHQGEALAPREVVLDRLKTHINTVLQRYRGRILGWDVVNEAIADRDEYWLRPSRFVQTIGEDFVVEAFKLAHAADPEMPLYYNDYGNEMPAKRQRTVKLLKQIQAGAPRLDAVGIQGHWVCGQVPLAALEEAIIEYHHLGLKVMITELDIDVLRGHDPAFGKPPEPKHPADQADCPPGVLQQQADEYAALFRLFRKHADKITRVTFWGLHDGRSWLNNWPVRGRTNHGLLFDRDLNPKPAYHAVMAV